jgi:hypothetical protein
MVPMVPMVPATTYNNLQQLTTTYNNLQQPTTTYPNSLSQPLTFFCIFDQISNHAPAAVSSSENVHPPWPGAVQLPDNLMIHA